MNITRWSPDTCECVVDYSWDEKVPLESRVLNLFAVNHKCPAHSSLSDEEVYNVLWEENKRKNRAIGLIANEALPQGTEDEKSNFGMECLWSFNKARLLTIKVPSSLSPITITAAKSKIISELGVNRINISKLSR